MRIDTQQSDEKVDPGCDRDFTIVLVRAPAGEHEDEFSKKHSFPPLGIGYLAAFLRQKGFQVHVIDCYSTRQTCRDAVSSIRRCAPVGLVGVSILSEGRHAAFRLIREIRRALQVPIVAGGAHPSLATEDTLRNVPEIDWVVVGEGEETLAQLAEKIEANEDVRGVPGLAYMEGDSVRFTPKRGWLEDLDKLPWPALPLLPMETYRGQISWRGGSYPAQSILTSRGCPIGCAFCASSLLSGPHRTRRPKSVVEELLHSVRTYGVPNFWFFDDTFTMDSSRAAEICREILSTGIGIRYVVQARVDSVNPELVRLLKESGCIQVRFGVETGSPTLMEAVVKKRITVDQVLCAAETCAAEGLEALFSFIISHPGETRDDAEKTMGLISKLHKQSGVRTALNVMRIYPGTKVERLARERGVLPKDFSWANSADSASESMREVYGDIPIYIENLDWAAISDYLFEWAEIERYAFGRNILGALRSLKSAKDIKRLYHMGKALCRRKIGRRKEKL